MRSYRGAVGLALVMCCAALLVRAQVTTTYTYDVHGQVKTVTRPNQSVTYAYDVAGNRTQMTATAPLAGRAAAQTALAATKAEADFGAVDRIAPAPPSAPSTLSSPAPISPLGSATSSAAMRRLPDEAR